MSAPAGGDGGAWSYERKNAYRDCGVDPGLFTDMAVDELLYPGRAPEN